MRFARPTALLAIAGFALAGCPAEPSAPPDPEIARFEVTPDQVEVDTPITVAWETRNAASIEITYGDGQTVDVAGLNPSAGQTDVSIATGGTYTFTLTVTGQEGAETPQVTATAEVTVDDPPPPAIVAFGASPAAVPAGDAATLSWEVTGADTLALADAAGNAVDVSGLPVDAGSVDVSPTADTTYVLTATGRGGTETAEVTVTVLPLPTVDSFEADQALYTAGDDAVLSWATTDATSVAIVDDAGTPVVEGGDPTGTVTVNPAVTTTYTLTATGDGGATTADLTVSVVPAVLDFVVAPTEVRAGDTVTLTWATEGSKSVEITGPDGFLLEAAPDAIAAGETTTVVSTAGDFTLTATSGSLSDAMTIPVTVTDAPRVRTLTVDPDALTVGETVQVAWTVDGIDLANGTDTVALTLGGQPVDLSAVADPSTGPVSLTLEEPGDAVLTLTATNASGSHALTATAHVYAAPVVDSFEALPTRVSSGAITRLSWATTNAATIRITKDGADLPSIDPAQVSGLTSDALAADATYVLHAANPVGYEVASAPLTVTVGAPVVASFEATPAVVAAGADVTLAWANDGGTQLEIADASGPVHTTSSLPAVASGSTTVTAPATLGSHDFTLTVSDAAGGSDTATTQIFVTDGPIIQTFFATADVVTEGYPLTLAWQVTDDQSATPVAPTLTLTDDQGQTYDVSAADPHDGSLDLTFTGTGTLTFTLTATTPGTTPATAQVTVEVVAPPAIDLFAANPASVSTVGGTVTPTTELSWQTHDTTSVRLYEVGGPEGVTLLHEATGAEVADGQLTVSLDTTTLYRLDAANVAGTETSRMLKVGVDLPVVDHFTVAGPDGAAADHVDVIAGQEATLDWATQETDQVGLWPLEPYYSDNSATDAFMDLSASATATQLTPSEADNGEVTFTFPAGFVFPFYARSMTAVQVDTNGYLNFDASQSVDHTNSAIPSTGTPDGGLIAPFWDDLTAGTAGTLWVDSGSNAHGSYQAVMWKNFELVDAAQGPSDLNFEVLLYDSGRIELRYGAMTSATNGYGEQWADGLSADVGFENASGSTGYRLLHLEAFPGGLSNRAFSVDFRMTAEEVTATKPFVDLSQSPSATQLTLSDPSNGEVTVFFPDAFEFPFYGRMLNSAEIYSEGYLNFDEKASRSSYNSKIPNASSPDGGLIAPFWDSLSAGANASVWMDTGSDADGRWLAFMWKGYTFSTSSYNGDLTFEALLYESGRIEFRYGTMTSDTSSSGHVYADGYYASAGFEDFEGNYGFEMFYSEEFTGGLMNRSFAFGPFVPTTGTLVISPTEDTTYDLVASNDNGTATASVSVGVWGDLADAQPSFTLTPSPAEEGDTVTIEWTVPEGTTASVSLAGQPLTDCTSTAEPGVHETSGTCDVPAGTRGDYDYTLSYSNPVSSGSVTETLTVYPRLEITRFAADAEFVSSGTTVTLDWTSTNATGVILRANGGPNLLTTESPDAGSISIDLTETTEFTLSINDDVPRYRAATLTVYVDAARFDTFGADHTQIPAGGSATISWTSTNTETITTNPYAVSVEETTDPFIEIAGTGNELTLDSETSSSGDADLTFPGGFTFPFYGVDRTEAQVAVDGMINFDVTSYLWTGGYELPQTTFGEGGVIAPFWDAQRLRTTSDTTRGAVYYELQYDGTQYSLVIEWKDVEIYDTDAAPSSLTYELILFEDGHFDFRYDTMTSSLDPDGGRFADGSSASIGFDDDTGTIGYSFSYNTSVPGGLSNRSFRLRPELGGNDSMTVRPTETTTYQVCANGGGYTDCRDVTIQVVQPGDVVFSELMPDPSAVSDADGEWFEVRNASAADVDLAGWTVTDGEDTFTVPADAPFVLAPGAFAVFARGDASVNGGVDADFVYGAAAPNLALANDADQLTLAYDGVTIDDVAWDTAGGWTLTPGASLSLDGRYFDGNPATNDSFGTAADPIWCTSADPWAVGSDLGSPGTRGTSCVVEEGYALDRGGATFIDISATGTPLPGAIPTNHYDSVPGGMGFTAPFFADTVGDQVTVSCYGWMSFGPVSSADSTDDHFPDSGTPNGVVAPFWDFQYARDDGTSMVYYQTLTVDGHQVFVVQWDRFQRSSYDGILTYQAQIWDNGNIALVLEELLPDPGTSSTGLGYYAGSSASVGFENQAGDRGVEFSYHDRILTSKMRLLYLKQ